MTELKNESGNPRAYPVAAGDPFREHGVDGVGVDAVMKQAGLTHGGFYLHFPSKEALAAEVSQSLLEKAARNGTRSVVPLIALRRSNRSCVPIRTPHGSHPPMAAP